MTTDLTVLACGGNSLVDPKLPPTVQNQFTITAQAMVPVAGLIARGEHIALTHGNGPQVGFMVLRSELASKELHQVPLDSLVADTQGSIGYMIQRALREELRRKGMDTEVATVVTEVEVDHNDKAFEEPTKPIGLFYTEEQARVLEAERGWDMVEDAHRGWRRVVASPVPVSIVQLETIRRLVEAGVSVVCCGGGGIPVERDEDGHIIGLEAVIDKDRASALLAVQLGARRLVITTAIDAVYADFRGPNQRALRRTTLEEIRQLGRDGHFAPGSMRPKMEAAIYFLNRGGEEVIVCKPEQLVEAWDGEAGTHITRD